MKMLSVYSIIERFFGATVSKTAAAAQQLLEQEAFARELARERARSDRYGSTFCLMAISIDVPRDSEEYREMLALLVGVLQDRLRICDTAGWFDNRIGVIFPHTPSAHVGAIWQAIQDELRKELYNRGEKFALLPPLKSEFFAYPGAEAGKTLYGVN